MPKKKWVLVAIVHFMECGKKTDVIGQTDGWYIKIRYEIYEITKKLVEYLNSLAKPMPIP